MSANNTAAYPKMKTKHHLLSLVPIQTLERRPPPLPTGCFCLHYLPETQNTEDLKNKFPWLKEGTISQAITALCEGEDVLLDKRTHKASTQACTRNPYQKLQFSLNYSRLHIFPNATEGNLFHGCFCLFAMVVKAQPNFDLSYFLPTTAQ